MPESHRHPAARATLGVVCVALLAGCSGVVKVETEQFGSTTAHARAYPASLAPTCEAARRALLSQGYVITLAGADHVKGRKNFQPDPEVHMEIEFHVVCASDGQGDRRTIAFVNALQDRYALKKSNNSASVGVGAIGSLSLPFSSSDESLVRVASETITAAPFYDRFFALLQRYLVAGDSPPPDARASDAPLTSR